VSDDALIKLADGTRTLREIAEATGGNYHVIAHRIRTLGLKAVKARRSPRYSSDEGRKLNAEVAQLWSKGHSFEAIADMLGITAAGASRWHDWHMWDVGP